MDSLRLELTTSTSALSSGPIGSSAGGPIVDSKTRAATDLSLGRFEGTFVRERLVDAIADRLGLDRVTVRRRNARSSTIPATTPLLLDKALAEIGWEALPDELRRRRAAGELVGAASPFFVEEGGLGPVYGTRITIDATGTVELITGRSWSARISRRRWRRFARRRWVSTTAGCGLSRDRPIVSNTASGRTPRALRHDRQCHAYRRAEGLGLGARDRGRYSGASGD